MEGNLSNQEHKWANNDSHSTQSLRGDEKKLRSASELLLKKPKFRKITVQNHGKWQNSEEKERLSNS